MRVAWIAGMVGWIAGCGGSPTPVSAPDNLAAAVVDPMPGMQAWPRRLWWKGSEDDVWVTLTWVEGRDAVIATVQKPSGDFSAWQIDGEGAFSRAEAVLNTPGATPATSASTRDGKVRVMLHATDEGQRIDVVDSEGNRTLTTFPANRTVLEPQLSPDGTALFLKVEGDRPGIVQIALDGQAMQAVIPGAVGLWRVMGEPGGAPQIVYTTPSQPGALWQASAPSEPLQRASDLLRKNGLPPDMIEVVVGADGELLIPTSCGQTPVLHQRLEGEGVRVGDGLASLGALCGPRCVTWYAATAEGSPQELARLEQPDAGGVIHARLAPEVGLEGEVFAPGERAEKIPRLAGCLDEPPGNIWMGTRWWRAPEGQKLLDLRVGDAGELVVRGLGGPYTWSTVFAPGKEAISSPSAGHATRASSREAKAADGTRAVLVEGGIEIKPATGEPFTLPIDEKSGGEPTALSFRADGSLLYTGGVRSGGLFLFDAGAIAHKTGAPKQLSGLAGLDAPVEASLGGQAGVFAIERVAGGRDAVWWFAPPTQDDVDAWRRGPLSLLDVKAHWVSVLQRADGTLARCEGTQISLGATSDGGFLKLGDQKMAAQAATWDGQTLRVLAQGDQATLRVLATLRVAGALAVWEPHAMDGVLKGTRWLPEEDAASLPLAGACPTGP